MRGGGTATIAPYQDSGEGDANNGGGYLRMKIN
jgi:hypothetical protein